MDVWDLRFHANGKPLYIGAAEHEFTLAQERFAYMLEPLNQDRRQTYEIAARGAEANPLLGPRPSRMKIEALIGLTEIGLYLLDQTSPWLERKLPGGVGETLAVSYWLPVLVYDSVRLTEMLVVEYNEAMSFARKRGIRMKGAWPPAFAMGYTFRF